MVCDSSRRWPIYLLPGMGLDRQLFALQRTRFPQVIVPEWLKPETRESVAQYSRRMALSLNESGPCLLGGMSFGGLVALEMAQHLDARACVLISSLKSPQEMPLWARIAGPAAWLLPQNADRWVSCLGHWGLRILGPVSPPSVRAFLKHLSKTRSPMLKWACEATIRWQGTAATPCPIYQIHGDADPIFPRRWLTPDRLVRGGGHVLPLTHPFVVNEFIQDVVDRLAAEQPSSTIQDAVASDGFGAV